MVQAIERSQLRTSVKQTPEHIFSLRLCHNRQTKQRPSYMSLQTLHFFK
jgi:hypothetical protein